MVEAFISSFFLIFLSELFDKTQLLIFSLGLRYKNKLQVFLGSLSAHFIMDLIAILFGFYLAKYIPSYLVKFSVAIAFIIIGFMMLFKKEEEHKASYHRRSPFLASFALIFASELGDKTQFSSALLSARYNSIVLVLLGTLLALALAISLNLFIGDKLSKFVSEKTIMFFTALLFVIFGIIMLI